MIRVDFNVPLNEKLEITDDTRMRAAIPTIKKVLAGGGSVILMSHLGRPKNGPEDKFSLKHIQKHLEELTGVPVKFAEDCVGEVAEKAAADLKPGEILLLENLRFHKEEEKGDEEFARQLSKLGMSGSTMLLERHIGPMLLRLLSLNFSPTISCSDM